MLAQAGARLDEINKQPMLHTLWLDVRQKPRVSFVMGYGHDVVFLKYYVAEKYIAALHKRTNEPVFKDSCVGFFIRFGHDLNYYNLEFNCAGTVLGQYGCGKAGRQFIDRRRLELIDTQTSIAFNGENGLFEWEITIAIPAEVFQFHYIDSFAGMTCSLNFSKCGDALPERHYLAWNKIHALAPDFHRPEYFGKGIFVRSEILVGV
ncbi:cellulose/xylan binding protein with CBM9 domain [Mucilaginibacter yixingensis]|uniref:Cellulose/xylan binding protein with CBM9 domain n=2 Tax=Mucilaginibacter yixingensis TaxID=1295612 RepID=A0A2T5J604_9SPHI|nr:cellulose/xylan binding protein with CBM9 domain [Mucilaginibacter yixingensis]